MTHEKWHINFGKLDDYNVQKLKEFARHLIDHGGSFKTISNIAKAINTYESCKNAQDVAK